MKDDVLIRAEDVSKKFCRNFKKSLWYGVKDAVADVVCSPSSVSLRGDEFWAIEDVSFELRRGECLGLIGRNGAGKTTLLKMLNGLIKPDKGVIELHGRVGALIALGAGFNPILTGRENIYVNGAVLGLTKGEIDHKLDEIVDFAELSNFVDTAVQNYSSGMQVRLGFAIATAVEPDILLLDEVLAVGDRAFRAKCSARLSEILNKAAVIIVSHDDAQIRQRCDRVLWMADGKVCFEGNASKALRLYQRASHQEAPRRLFTQPPITSVEIQELEVRSDEGHVLIGSFDIECTTHVEVDHAIATIESTTSVACQSIPIGLPLELRTGTTRVQIRSDRLQLAAGKYHVSLLFSTNAGKQILFNFICAAEFTVIGDDYLWAPYQPRIEIAKSNAT